MILQEPVSSLHLTREVTSTAVCLEQDPSNISDNCVRWGISLADKFKTLRGREKDFYLAMNQIYPIEKKRSIEQSCLSFKV